MLDGKVKGENFRSRSESKRDKRVKSFNIYTKPSDLSMTRMKLG